MKLTTCIRAALAPAALALALTLPATAAAVPSVTTVLAKTGDAGVTYLTDPTGASLVTTQTRYVVSLDGWTAGYVEDNGASGHGVIDYSALPAAYRAPMTAEQKRTYAPAQTDVQPHATCAGVAALADGVAILAWQSAAGGDPSFDYVPWQATSAGLGDDPASWIPVVRAATGVDLARLTTAAALRSACEGLGGTYHAADTRSGIADALLGSAVLPLQAQVASLKRARASADRAAATARAAQKEAEAAYQALFTKPIDLTLASRRVVPANGLVAMVTGSPTDPVVVTLELAKRTARKLHLPDRVLAEADGTIGADGAVLVTLKLDRDVRRALAKAHGRARRVASATVHAVSGGNEDSAKAVLVR